VHALSQLHGRKWRSEPSGSGSQCQIQLVSVCECVWLVRSFGVDQVNMLGFFWWSFWSAASCKCSGCLWLARDLICDVISTLFFLFYFNRVFAKTISVLARLYLRWLGNPHYIDIESLQISILAGRLFFGKVVYHGPNETITIVGGQITWRYWLRRVRHVLPDDTQGGEDGAGKSSGLPCRILVEMKGLEWFIYNRSPQYDWVMEEMTAAVGEDNHQGHPPTAPRHTDSYLAGDDEEDGKQTPKTGSTTLAPRPSSSAAAAATRFEDIAKSPYLKMLPIKLECNRGAVVMGNNNTPSVLIAHFEKALGVVDARKVDILLCLREYSTTCTILISIVRPVIIRAMALTVFQYSLVQSTSTSKSLNCLSLILLCK
jgi:hypothetical protein